MKQGTIRKQGTISKLKNDVSGFNVMLKLKQPSDDVDGPSSPQRLKTVDELKAELKEWYKDGEIRDEHSVRLLIECLRIFLKVPEDFTSV